MKARILPLCAVAVLALALGAVMTACDGGGGGELTLAKYFEKLEQLDAEKDARNAEAEDRLDEDFDAAGSDGERLEAYRDYFASTVSSLGEFVDGLDDLTPPAEAADAHDSAVEAGRNMLEDAEHAEDLLAEAESLTEIDGAVSGSIEESGQAFEQTCLDLQAIADENDIEVDLDCED